MEGMLRLVRAETKVSVHFMNKRCCTKAKQCDKQFGSHVVMHTGKKKVIVDRPQTDSIGVTRPLS